MAITQSHNDFIPTRRSLLSRLRNWEDQDSWQDFFETYWPLIYGLALKSGLTESEAQEVVQETVLTVAKKMEGFRYDPALGSFKGWLLTITRWRIADQFRKRRPEVERQPMTGATTEAEQVIDPNSIEIEQRWNEEWSKNILRVATDRVRERIDPELFQAFDFLTVKQWSARKVAAALRINLAQVYYAKYKVTKLIKQEVQRLQNQSF